MADSALIEVFGPLEDVERALVGLPGMENERTNRVGCTLLDYAGLDVTVGDENPATVDVDAPDGVDVMPLAGQLFRALAGVVDFPMQLVDGSTDEAVQARGAIPAN